MINMQSASGSNIPPSTPLEYENINNTIHIPYNTY